MNVVRVALEEVVKNFTTCPYCLSPAERVKGSVIYPYRHDLHSRDYWACIPCQAWVGCHPDGSPMGRLANVVLRGAKMDAHEAFDPLWQAKMRRDKCTKNEAKRAGYRWLAKVLSIPEDRCHIAYMDVDECRRVVRVCKELRS